MSPPTTTNNTANQPIDHSMHNANGSAASGQEPASAAIIHVDDSTPEVSANHAPAPEASSPVPTATTATQAILARDALLQTIEREKVVARRWAIVGQLLMLILVIQAVSSVVTSLNSYAQDTANCKKPIPIWLLVNFGLSFVINICMVVSSCIKHHTSPTDAHTQTAATLQKFGLIMIIPLLVWAVVGAVWVWGPGSTECDDTIHKSAQTSVGICLVMAAFNLAMAPFAYMFIKKRMALQKIKAEDRARIIKEGNDAEQSLLVKVQQIHVQPQQQQQQQQQPIHVTVQMV